jgi:hypothetical protein
VTLPDETVPWALVAHVGPHLEEEEAALLGAIGRLSLAL